MSPRHMILPEGLKVKLPAELFIVKSPLIKVLSLTKFNFGTSPPALFVSPNLKDGRY